MPNACIDSDMAKWHAQVVSQDDSVGLDQLRAEYVVRIIGQLRMRKDPNDRLPTGQVELVAEEVSH
jgi:aspartyl-tRNA synthetase